jgi:hypothetical protein
MLQLGAPGRLLADGALAEVLPLDDERLLEAANPATPDGRVRLDAAKVEAREAAIARSSAAVRPRCGRRPGRGGTTCLPRCGGSGEAGASTSGW